MTASFKSTNPKTKKKKSRTNKRFRKQDERKKAGERAYINNAAPIKTTILTGEDSCLEENFNRSQVQKVILLVRGIDRWTRYSDLFTGSYFLKEKEMSLESTTVELWGCQSHTGLHLHSCQVEGQPWPARTEALLALLVGEGLYWATRIATRWDTSWKHGRLRCGLPKRECLSQSDSSAWGGELLTHERASLKRRTEDELKLTRVQGLWYWAPWEPELRASVVKVELERWGHRILL